MFREELLPKKRAVENAKTPAAAPVVDTKPVKKADPAGDKKDNRNAAPTKDSKPINREGKR